MKNAIAALIKARKAMGPLLKESVNPHFKSRYVDLQGVYDTCLGALMDNDLIPVQGVSDSANGGHALETVLFHASGEVIGPYLYPLTPARQNDPQSLGAAVTYARRYSLMAILSLAPEDNDGASEPRAPAAVGNGANVAPAGKDFRDGMLNAQKAAEEAAAAPTAKVAELAKLLGKGPAENAKWAQEKTGRTITSLKQLYATEIDKLIEAARGQ